ncbi:hypothetical protein [Flavobacterium salmonis]|uniref:Lipoprotein n=1 Tax=Flavobacterium salmonis TaxID=2654844 RepID=A0A6V6ZCZ6_9FLAO|nr:hypothetical protein [Flavobacterium salmonis]CAD0009436.1 hypothetical protein FLAT13_04923 [Flavobacterium salmonis]
MKKYASLLLFALLLNGCDDGDLTVEQFDFDDITDIEHCSDNYELLYKLKSQESLLLQIPEDQLKNTKGEQTLSLSTTGNYKLVYRRYDGTVTKSSICDAIRPATPNVTNEWFATGGTVIINTFPNYITGEIEGSTKITGYTHNISFTGVTYPNSSGILQTQSKLAFGKIVTNEDNLNLTFGDEKAHLCTSTTNGTVVYNFSEGTSIAINNIDPALIPNQATPSGSPRTGLISATQNRVIYNVYSNGLLTTDYFCQTPIPATPVITQTWTGLSGSIEVTTTTVGPTVFKHVIVLKNVILDNGNVNFQLGTSFLLGELQTQSN